MVNTIIDVALCAQKVAGIEGQSVGGQQGLQVHLGLESDQNDEELLRVADEQAV